MKHAIYGSVRAYFIRLISPTAPFLAVASGHCGVTFSPNYILRKFWYTWDGWNGVGEATPRFKLVGNGMVRRSME
jgi:hypothetical protein